MRALHIQRDAESIEELDIKIQANTFYTFFNSILIDEIAPIKEHMLYCDANALSEKKKPFFIGEQLVIGDALLLGRYDFEDVDAKISKEELASLIKYEVNDFYREALELLSQTNINLYRTFEVQKNEEKLALNSEWVLYTFNMADERTRAYFIDELKKVLQKSEAVEPFMQKMAQLALNAAA